MASKLNKSESTSGIRSSRGGSEEKRGDWAKKCIKWLAIAVPASTVHPLNNPKLLSRIINSAKSNYYDLKNWRLVNRLWHEVTLDPWRSTATLVIIPDFPRTFDPCTSKTMLKFLNQPQNKKGATMSELLQNILDPSDPYDLDTKPFHRIKLRGMHMEDEMEHKSIIANANQILNVLPRLLDLIGLFVTYLHFEYCKFENTMKLGAFHKLLLEKMPFTVKLVLTNCVFKENFLICDPNLIIRYDYNLNVSQLKVCGDFPMALACLLTFIPNLKEIKVRQGSVEIGGNRHYFSNVVIPFANMRKFNTRWLNMTNMDLMHTDAFRMGFSPTNQFRNAKLPLKLLSVEISPFLDRDPKGINNKGMDGASRINSSEDLIAPMLREHKDTLKVFKIFRPPFSGPFPNFPFGIDCEHMEELRVWGNVIENLNFLPNMPNLKVLYLNTYCFDKWDEMKDLLEQEFPYEYQPFQGDIVWFTGVFYRSFKINMKCMTELTIELAMERESIRKLSEWMPNLKTFRSIFNRATFQSTCAAMPGLDELGILYGSEVGNNTITGIHDGVAVYMDNVTSFKNLKRFRMDAYCGKSTLRDSSVYLGFLRMRALQYIQICVSREMTKKAEDALKLFVPGPVIFIRNYDTGPHDNYDCCKRSEFLREVLSRIPRPTVPEFGAAIGRPYDGSIPRLSRAAGRGNVPGPLRGNVPGPSHGNVPGPSRGNVPEPSQGNAPGPSRGNVPGPSRGNVPGTSRSNVQGTSYGAGRGNFPGPSRPAGRNSYPGPSHGAGGPHYYYRY